MAIKNIIKEIKEKAIGPAILRFAPCPNGKPSLGHVKSLVLLDSLRSALQGKLYIRFDETNPTEILPQAYGTFKKLLEEYNIPVDGIIYSADNALLHKEECKKLYLKQKSFFCYCGVLTDVKDLTSCTCMLRAGHRTEDQFEEILLKQKQNKKGPCSLKLKTQRNDNNFVIYRVINNQWYPTIALQGPVDDHHNGVNVIARGTDLVALEQRQREIHGLLYDKPFPLIFYWGRVSLWDSKNGHQWVISKSTDKGSKIPSLEYFRKWGYTPQAKKVFLQSYGFTKNEIKLDLVKLNHCLISSVLKEGRIRKVDRPLSCFMINKEGYYQWKQGDKRFFAYYRKNMLLNYTTNKLLVRVRRR